MARKRYRASSGSRSSSRASRKRRRRSVSSSYYSSSRSSRSSPSIFRRRRHNAGKSRSKERPANKAPTPQKDARKQGEKDDAKGKKLEIELKVPKEVKNSKLKEKQAKNGKPANKAEAKPVAKEKVKEKQKEPGKQPQAEPKEKAGDGKAKEKPKQKPTEKPTEKPKEKLTEKPKEKLTEKPKEKVATPKAKEKDGKPSDQPKPKTDSAKESKLQDPPNETIQAEVSQDAKEKPPEKPRDKVLDKGGIEALQQSLSQDTHHLQFMLLQAKRDMDDRRDTLEKQERREKEYYRGDFGEPLGPENRLLLEEALGQGAFSTVFRCRDMKAEGERHYAVKFIRKNSVLRSATEQEVKLMRRLRTKASELDPEGARCFLGLAGPEVLEHEGHLALCFQLQKCDLRSALKRWGQGQGLPLGLVRNYARNIFMALRALRLVSIVHSDLKPDNLLVSMDKMSVKLSDFGSAMDVKDRFRPEKAAESLQPRFYRAPEVILGQPYDTQIDVWSAGCTVFELATGKFLFTGRDNNEMLFRMLRQLGAFSRKFCGAGKLSDKHFRREDGAFRCGADAHGAPLRFMGREEFPRPSRPILEELSALQTDGEGAGQVAAKALADLVLACVSPDPGKRLEPDTALATCFLRPSGNQRIE
ncbi:unnamed protein product [Effrenium voratum]|uniref:Protein kinase domain-containing protein n=1 Tax=Effrenium voratum TaxID=2562239 RepID=A0AA36N756_9DINO|nr:unnamed protein product [Effrenium voratum]CAJ1428731.1 unnamed protein product [Effrenium voratum]